MISSLGQSSTLCLDSTLLHSFEDHPESLFSPFLKLSSNPSFGAISSVVIGSRSCCVSSSSADSSSSSSADSSSSASASSAKALYFLRVFFVLLAFFFRLRSALIAERLSSPFSKSSTFSASLIRANLRFCARDRVTCDDTLIPVGMCLSWTAQAVLFYMLYVSDREKLKLVGFDKNVEERGEVSWV